MRTRAPHEEGEIMSRSRPSRRRHLGLLAVLVLVGGCASPSDQPGESETGPRATASEPTATPEGKAEDDSPSSRAAEIAGDTAVRRAQEVLPDALLPTGYHHVQDVKDPRTGSVVRLYGTDQYDAFLAEPERDKGPVIAVRVVDGADPDQASWDGDSLAGVDSEIAVEFEDRVPGARLYAGPDMESAFSIGIPTAGSTIIIAGTGVPLEDLVVVADGVLR